MNAPRIPHVPTPRTRDALALRPIALALCLGLLTGGLAQARCIDEEAPDPVGEARSVAPGDPGDPQGPMRGLLAAAVQRSQALGAARLLAEAARQDVEEALASGKPQVSASVQTAYVGSETSSLSRVDGAQARLGLNAGGPIWDAGRTEHLAQWRDQLARAAAAGQIGAEEQVMLQTVNLALERSRYRQQVRVYQQFGRKMACLVEALEQIVATDRGRASELVQAQKSQAQAELQQVQAQSQLRQTEIRLQRFVGDRLPPAEGLSALWLQPPALAKAQSEAESAPDLQQLEAQSRAQARYAEAVRSGQRPQLGWNAGGSAAAGVGSPRSWSIGLNLNVPLYSPGDDAGYHAAVQRAEASRLQWQDAIESRRAKVAEVHEQASSAFDRAARVVGVVRDSDRVRNFTLQQWRQLGRRSLFDVMSSESDYVQLRVQQVNALVDGQQATTLLWSLGRGVQASLGR